MQRKLLNCREHSIRLIEYRAFFCPLDHLPLFFIICKTCWFKSHVVPLLETWHVSLRDPLWLLSCKDMNRLCEGWECDPMTPLIAFSRPANSLQIILFLFAGNWKITSLKLKCHERVQCSEHFKVQHWSSKAVKCGGFVDLFISKWKNWNKISFRISPNAS